MLGKGKNSGQEQTAEMTKNQREASGEASISIVASGMTVVGDAESDGTIRIEGRVEGTLRAEKSVVVGRSGEVVGDIITQDAVISGRVSGNITAESRLELQSTCNVNGELRSRRVQLDEGAKFNGQMHMEEGSKSQGMVVKPASAPESVKGETGQGETGKPQQAAS